MKNINRDGFAKPMQCLWALLSLVFHEWHINWCPRIDQPSTLRQLPKHVYVER